VANDINLAKEKDALFTLPWLAADEVIAMLLLGDTIDGEDQSC